MSFDCSNPDPKAIAFGGVLTGSAIEVEHIMAMAMEKINSLPGSDTATGISKLAVAVLLITVVIPAAMTS